MFRGRMAWTSGAIKDISYLVAGVAADALTHEMVHSRRPLALRDAGLDPRPVRSSIRAWGVTSVLGVPLVLDERVEGIVYLDDLGRFRDFSPATQDLAFAYGKFAASASARVISDLRSSTLETEQRRALAGGQRRRPARRAGPGGCGCRRVHRGPQQAHPPILHAVRRRLHAAREIRSRGSGARLACDLRCAAARGAGGGRGPAVFGRQARASWGPSRYSASAIGT